MSGIKCRATSLDGVRLIEPRVFPDRRGSFMELFHAGSFEAEGLPVVFVQDNLSNSHRGIIRGLHFQSAPFEQGKLITCLRGAIFDVAVDLRPGAASFGKWEAFELSEEDKTALYLPEGFAHGFQALEDHSLVLYKCTRVYSRDHEGGIVYDDPDLGIPWPLSFPVLSPKDAGLPSFRAWKGSHGLA